MMTPSSTMRAGRDARRGAPGMRLGRAGFERARNLDFELASDGPFLSPEDGRLTRGGRCVIAGRRTLSPIGGLLCVARENLSLTLRHEPGSQAPREGSERLPCVVALHPQRMEQARGKFSGIEYAQK